MTNNPPTLIFDRSVPGRIGYQVPEGDLPTIDPRAVLPDQVLRKTPAELPEVSEPEVLRHFIGLSVRNHHVDRDIYPLGSCTMKYNPKINDAIANLPGFAHAAGFVDSVPAIFKDIYSYAWFVGLFVGGGIYLVLQRQPGIAAAEAEA